MRQVQALHPCHQAHKVATLHHLLHGVGVQVLLLDVGETVIAIAHLHILHLLKDCVILERRVRVAVSRHVVDSLHLIAHAANLARDILNVAAAAVVDNPVAHVVESGRVVAHVAVTVTQVLKVVSIVAPRVATVYRRLHQGVQRLDKRRAVKLVNVYREHLSLALKRVGNVRRALQLVGIEAHQLVGVGQSTLNSFHQQRVNLCRVISAVKPHLLNTGSLGNATAVTHPSTTGEQGKHAHP